MQNQQVAMKRINNFIFSLTDMIGEGSSSTVYRGKHSEKDLPAAIKAIQLKKITNQVEKQLLSNQVQALKSLSHPNILTVFEIYQTSNNLYIISQLCDQDLVGLLRKTGPIAEPEALGILKQIASAFQYLTKHTVLHRDVKPSNILLSDKTVKVADFGFCEFMSARKPGKQFYNVGSPQYMSPEAYKQTNYSQKSDMWGVGLVYLEMLHGKLPFEGLEYDDMIKVIATGSAYSELKISGFSKMILSRMLSVDIDRRLDFQQLIKFLNSRPSDLEPKPSLPAIMNRGTPLAGDAGYRNSLMNRRPETLIPDKPNGFEKGDKDKSRQPVLIEARPTSNTQIPHIRRADINFCKNQKENERSNLVLQHTHSEGARNRHSTSEASINAPRRVSKTPSNYEQSSNTGKQYSQLATIRVESLLKIIAILHSDPCVRLNPNKLRLLKLIYSWASIKLKSELELDVPKSAELTNLQIILSGYGYLEFEEVAVDDSYFQYIKSQMGSIPEAQLHPYIDFLLLNAMKTYAETFSKEWKYEDLEFNEEGAASFFALKRLLDFHAKLKGKPLLEEINEHSPIPFFQYSLIMHAASNSQY